MPVTSCQIVTSGVGAMRYFHWDGAVWQLDTVDTDCGYPFGLGYDGDGAPMVAYLASGDLKLARHEAGRWTTELIRQGSFLHGFAFAADADGRPGLTYWDDLLALYSYHDGAAWQTELLFDATSVAAGTALGYDHDSNPGCVRAASYNRGASMSSRASLQVFVFAA